MSAAADMVARTRADRSGPAGSGTAHSGPARSGPARSGPARSGPARLIAVAAAALSVVVLAGCGGSGADSAPAPGAAEDELAASCQKVGERLLAVSEEALARLPEAGRMRLQSHLGQVRDQYVAACKGQKWPAEARTCLSQAPTAEEFDRCARDLAAGLAPPAPAALPSPAADAGAAPEAPPARAADTAAGPVAPAR